MKRYFVCPECRMVFDEEIWAKKCEQWCKKYKSCNMEIMKHAVKK